MLIVTQNKLATTENMELMIYPVYDDIDRLKIKCYKIQNDLQLLGYYKTEERAKEVLQEIIRTRTDFEYYKCASESEKDEIDSFMKTKYEFFDTYEMPEE